MLSLLLIYNRTPNEIIRVKYPQEASFQNLGGLADVSLKLQEYTSLTIGVFKHAEAFGLISAVDVARLRIHLHTGEEIEKFLCISYGWRHI
jgi:hypothetical protein